MRKPSSDVGTRAVSNANDLSISFASILPSGPDEVASFLFGAAFAIGGREADLARALGVSRATLSSWKARGAIPEQHRQWFLDQFPILVLSSKKPAPGDDFRQTGLPAALHLIRGSKFNPFGLSGLDDAELLETLADHMGGLVRLAQFIQLQLSDADLPAPRLYAQVAQIVGEIARASKASIFPRSMVSQ